MTVNFYKYQGTGNDFVMIDNRTLGLVHDRELIERLCHRRFGIGADGLIYLQNRDGFDFEMVYFNSDGNESSMCGNGGRCLIRFAHDLDIISTRCKFWAIDGEHEGEILDNGTVSLKMKDVDLIENSNGDYILNTGSPHYVQMVNEVKALRVVAEAQKIRYNERFAAEGINVNFAQKLSRDELFVRTYERGVEDETLSCGTGVVASAITLSHQSGQLISLVKVETLGGKLQVSFEPRSNTYRNIFLQGPAEKVYQGSLDV